MKAIITTALLIGLCGFVRAEDKVDPVGTWKCEYDIGGQKRTSTLTITKDGEKLAGTMDWPDQKGVKLKEVKVKDGELSFSAERELKEMKLMIEYKLKIEKDTFKGKADVDAGGEKRSFELEGKREKK
jgi:major membrane immunogen (membrane-anchored lipoprotein)